jgi:hypothetical protein
MQFLKIKYYSLVIPVMVSVILALVGPYGAVQAAGTYTITAVACAGGSISPSGTSLVNAGDNLTFTITPHSGKQILDVRVDLAPVETSNSYTFSNIQANHSIAVSFAPYDLQIAAGSASITISTNRFRSLDLYGQVLTDNNDEMWKGTPLYILIRQLYPGDSTNYTVKAVSSDGTNDITFTNSAEFPFLEDSQKDLFIVADQYSTDDGATWTPIPPTSSGKGGWTWAPLRLTGPRQDGSGGSAFHHSGAGLVKLELSHLAPWVTHQPADISQTEGETAIFNAGAEGDPIPAIQWQELNPAAGSDWQDVAGAETAELTLNSITRAQNGYQYRAVFTNDAGSLNSRAATLTVRVPPTILTQPKAVSVRSGGSAKFSATADGDPLPGVQWQLSTDSGNSWNEVAGATASTLTLSAVNSTQNGYLYRAVFSSSAGTATSEAAKLTVTKPSGGGGGGGGGGSSANPTSITLSGFTASNTLEISSSGVTAQAVRITTLDGSAALDIAQGTSFVNSLGASLTGLSAASLTAPPAAPEGQVLISACTFGPNGAKFVPAVGLSFAYDPAGLPSGVAESDLYLALMEGSAWTRLVNSQVDSATHSVNLKIDHFSSYALIGKLTPPAPTPDANWSTTTTPAPVTSTLPVPTTSAATPLSTPAQTSSPAIKATSSVTTSAQLSLPAMTAEVSSTIPTTSSTASKSGANWTLVLIIGLAVLVIIGLIVWWGRRKKRTT